MIVIFSGFIMSAHEKLNYVEFAAADLTATKAFFTAVFDWQFIDYDPEYTAFNSDCAGLDGGFYQANASSLTQHGGALLVFYSENISQTLSKVEQHGGQVISLYLNSLGDVVFILQSQAVMNLQCGQSRYSSSMTDHIFTNSGKEITWQI
eukprot:TRINITY_DN7533_c0_g4_i2.p1 TRINITY_DN7533_c0_g4~~TRINITY_DN7533_c0_g4_i2.p1  ORF type:complete len:150 (-),score=26.33 TRINITY_DN7533_c0_g4_i2:604-1053(-)